MRQLVASTGAIAHYVVRVIAVRPDIGDMSNLLDNHRPTRGSIDRHPVSTRVGTTTGSTDGSDHVNGDAVCRSVVREPLEEVGEQSARFTRSAREEFGLSLDARTHYYQIDIALVIQNRRGVGHASCNIGLGCCQLVVLVRDELPRRQASFGVRVH